MKLSTKTLCMNAIFIALTFVVTRFIQIPIPLGYFNIGNAVILFACILMPSPSGILIGGLGSALADLTSYPVYTLPTLVIKCLFPLVFYRLKRMNIGKLNSTILAAAVSTLIPLFGYTATGCVLYGFLPGLAQFPGLLLEYIANLIIVILLYRTVEKLGKYIR